MKIIAQNTPEKLPAVQRISTFFKEYRISSLLKECMPQKEKGFSAVTILSVLLSIVFTNRSMYMNFRTRTNEMPFSKDTLYRFLNSPKIHWQKFTARLSAVIAQKSVVSLTDDSRKNVFIADDTLFERKNAKKVELATTVFDHAQYRYTRGFRLLTLGWSDGNTFLPVTSSLLSTEKSKNILWQAEATNGRTLAGKRRKQAQRKATEVMLELLDMAMTSGHTAPYVLFDSWFCSPRSLIAVAEKGLHVIAMAKKTSKVHYLFEGQKKSAKEIYQSGKKRRGCSRYLLSVETTAEKDGETLPVKLVYVRNRSNRKDYLVLVSTDLYLSEEEIIQLYGKRWATSRLWTKLRQLMAAASVCGKTGAYWHVAGKRKKWHHGFRGNCGIGYGIYL